MSSSRPTIRCGVIGLDHSHIFSMAHAIVKAGGEIVAYHAGPPDPRHPGFADGFGKLNPGARAAKDRREILEDATIPLVLSAGIPHERASIGLEVMSHGKDFMTDKPGVTELADLEALQRVQAETGRIFSVCFSERFENRATVRASELVAGGAIGRVIQTIGLGPHRLNAAKRPSWFFERARYGGILTDIGSHQMDQFLHFTGAEDARIAAARVANHAHPEFPELEDFGEVLLEADGASGYVRVDWFTPDGLESWGDGRLTLLGTEGFIEIRKNVDIGGRKGGSHLFLVDGTETHHIDCSEVALPYAGKLLDDVANRTETAMSQAHCFRACALALQAEAEAKRIPAGPTAANASENAS